MNDQATAYPLTWPTGWKRASFPRESSFGRHSMARVLKLLQDQLRLLSARKVVISSNVPLRQDGLPYANQPRVRDSGAAVYFQLDNTPVALACDKWNRVECNFYAIAKHIDALRGQERWGIGTVKQAFTGYMQLPAPMILKPWHIVLGVDEDCSFEQAQERYRLLAKGNHPDVGGTDQLMAEINAAWDEAKLARGWK